MDVVQERNANNQVTAQLVRDGNIGGILSRTTAAGATFYGYDGNGNVTLLTNGAGQDVGHYRYDAFGNTLEAAGQRAAENPYRFSTKELHGPSGLYDYGFRFYSPSMGRWLNRDPLQEEGGINLYAAMGNDPVNNVDDYGLAPDCRHDGIANSCGGSSDFYEGISGKDEDGDGDVNGRPLGSDTPSNPMDPSRGLAGVGGGMSGSGGGGASRGGGGGFQGYFARVKGWFSRPSRAKPPAQRAGSRRGPNRPDLLQKDMAAKAMMSQYRYGQGREIAGGKTGVPIRDVARLVSSYGGKPQDWVKISTDKFRANDGTQFEVHYYRNRALRKSVDPKMKITSFAVLGKR